MEDFEGTIERAREAVAATPDDLSLKVQSKPIWEIPCVYSCDEF